MPFVIADSFIPNVKLIPAKYEKRSNVKLNAPPPYAISTLFGAKDITTRNKQITFVLNWLQILAADLKPDLKFVNEEQAQKHFRALRVMVAIFLFTQAEIDYTYLVRSGKNAVLGQLLDETLGINSDNLLDPETRAACLITARDYINSKDCFVNANSLLQKKIAITQWNKLSQYLSSECNSLDKKLVNHYPITSILVPLCALPLQAAGYTTGYIFGDMLGKSTKLIPAKYAVSAAIGSGLLFVIGPTASVGVMLLAPTYAGKLVDMFCGVSMAYLLGATMSMVGTAVGLSLGMTLDLSAKILYKGCSLIYEAYNGEAKLPKLTGFMLVNGHRVIEGIEIQLVEQPAALSLEDNSANLEKELVTDEAAAGQAPLIFEFKDSGLFLKIGDQMTEIPWNTPGIPYIEELKKKFMDLRCEEVIESPLPADASDDLDNSKALAIYSQDDGDQLYSNSLF